MFYILTKIKKMLGLQKNKQKQILNLSEYKSNNLIKLLDLIKSIEVRDNSTIIRIDDNIIIENKKSSIMLNKGFSVNISGQIHLNPDIEYNEDDNMSELNRKLIESNKIKMSELEKSLTLEPQVE